MEVRLKDGRTIACEDEPAHSGAEGELYFSRDRQEVVKLYFNPDPNREASLDAIINRYNAVRDDSYWKNLFCWPSGVVVSPRLGVAMPRASKALRNLTWFLFPKSRARLPAQERGTWMGHVRIALLLSRAMRRLHQLGLCHADLSYNNCLVNPVTGDLVLIDLDGLVVPGILPPRVIGTPEFMAPEIITSSAKPSIATDLHALAVLIYRTLLFRHPLKGPKVHSANPEQDDLLAFGERALYIEHPTDHSNRPNNFTVTSELLGSQIQRLFQQAFVSGLHTPSARPQSANWEQALVRLADRVLPCGNNACEGKFFPFTDGRSLQCPWCKTPWRLTRSICILELYRPVSGRQGQYQTDNYPVVAWNGKTLHEWHVYADRPPGPQSDHTAVARCSYDPRKECWTLTNLSNRRFRVLYKGKNPRDAMTGETVVLEHETRILLGEDAASRLAVVRIGQIH